MHSRRRYTSINDASYCVWCLSILLSPRILLIISLVVIIQAFRLFISVNYVDHISAWSPRPAFSIGTASHQTDDEPLSYEDIEYFDKIFYSTTPPAHRDCGTPSHIAATRPSAPVTIVTLVGQSGREDHPGYLNFLKSLDANGYDRLLVLEPFEGLQEIRKLKRTNYSAETDFWTQRLHRFMSAARSFPPDSVLVFCDALDVFFTQHPSVLVNRFHAMQKSVVFAAEVLCDTVSCRTDFDLRDFLANSAPKGNAYRFLNAGMFMGRAKDLITVLSCALQNSKGGRDDQTAFTMCYRSDPIAIGLDHDSKLFGNIPPVQALFDESWSTYTIYPRENRAMSRPVTLLHRSHMPSSVFPVALHFLGLSFRRDLPFVPCQQFLRSKYNEFGDMIHLNDYALPGTDNAIAAQEESIDLTLMVSANLVLQRFMDSTAHRQVSIEEDTSECKTSEGGVALIRYLDTLSHSLNSILPPKQQLKSSSGALVRSVHVYIQLSLTELSSKTLLARSIHADYAGMLRDVTSCAENKLKWTQTEGDFRTEVKIVFDEAASGTLFPTSSPTPIGVMPLPFHGLDWVLGSSSDIQRSSKAFLVTVTGQHMYGSHTLSSLLSASQVSPVPAAFGHAGILIDETPASPVRISSTTLQYHEPLSAEFSARAAYMRSASLWSIESAVVDVLSSEGAVLYNISLLRDILDAEKPTIPPDDGCLFPYNLDAMLSGYLSILGVPRVQIPPTMSAGNRAIDLLLPGNAMPRPVIGAAAGEGGAVRRCNSLLANNYTNLQGENIESVTRRNRDVSVYQRANRARSDIKKCKAGRDLVSAVKKSWKKIKDHGIHKTPNVKADILSVIKEDFTLRRSIEMDELKYCPRWPFGAQSFSPLPEVPNLGGFSWKQNWVSQSATSPCTCHLFTRVVNGQTFLGKGQYLGQGQHLASRNGEFVLRLDAHARLCVYPTSVWENADTVPRKCFAAPDQAIADINSKEESNDHFYVALVDGSACFFKGLSPHFGGSAVDSGHRELVWCSPNERAGEPSHPRRLTAEAGDLSMVEKGETKKESMSAALHNRLMSMMKSICAKLYVPPSAWEDLLLVVADDGAIELQTSQSCPSSHQLCSTGQRTQRTSMAKCL